MAKWLILWIDKVKQESLHDACLIEGAYLSFATATSLLYAQYLAYWVYYSSDTLLNMMHQRPYMVKMLVTLRTRLTTSLTIGKRKMSRGVHYSWCKLVPVVRWSRLVWSRGITTNNSRK